MSTSTRCALGHAGARGTGRAPSRFSLLGKPHYTILQGKWISSHCSTCQGPSRIAPLLTLPGLPAAHPRRCGHTSSVATWGRVSLSPCPSSSRCWEAHSKARGHLPSRRLVMLHFTPHSPPSPTPHFSSALSSDFPAASTILQSLRSIPLRSSSITEEHRNATLALSTFEACYQVPYSLDWCGGVWRGSSSFGLTRGVWSRCSSFVFQSGVEFVWVSAAWVSVAYGYRSLVRWCGPLPIGF